MKRSRLLTLLIVIVLIAGAIYYLQAQKPKTAAPGKAGKEIVNPSGFINTPPITIGQFIGKKVVLVDFMTYSCINCERTYPYLNAWWEKYKDHGLLIIGIHSPEFDFEKVPANVKAAAEKFGLKFPLVLDNDHATWNAFGNLYWPHDYLIGIKGNVVADHIGEGDYDLTEKEIQAALKERKTVLGLAGEAIPGGLVSPAGAIEADAARIKSEETYFGSERNVYLASGIAGLSGIQLMPPPVTIKLGSLYLTGRWEFTGQYAENLSAGAKIIYRYSAKDVYFVASSEKGVKLQVKLDGQPLKTLTVKEERLYTVIAGADYGAHLLEITIEGPGLKAFTFTFG